MCSRSKFDTKYTWTREKSGLKYSFIGFSNTKLYYNEAPGHWRLELFSDPGTYAILNTTDYPLGTRSWSVYGDDCQEEDEVSEARVPWSLHTCEVDEFNCKNGMCIGIQKRCNGAIDCQDKSGTKTSNTEF